MHRNTSSLTFITYSQFRILKKVQDSIISNKVSTLAWLVRICDNINLQRQLLSFLILRVCKEKKHVSTLHLVRADL